MNVIYYCEAQVPNLNEKFAFISTCFPSAVDGDWEEVAKTLNRLDQFITKRYIIKRIYKSSNFLL